MAKTNIGQFSATAGSNTDVDSVSLAEGQLPGLLNDGIRALMALLAEAWDDLQGYTATGTDTYEIDTSTVYTSYDDCALLVVTFTNANTAAGSSVTLQLDDIATPPQITKNGGNDLAIGDIAAGSTHLLFHDGTNFEIIGRLGLSNVVEDTTPQLGGNLDPNSKEVAGDWIPSTDSTYDLGSSSKKWAELHADTFNPLAGLCQGRLTLTTGTPITTSDVSATSTLYFTPYNGNHVAIFDGTNWQLHEFTEMSLSLTGMTANVPEDIFLDWNAGTPQLIQTAWTNATTRATALTTQDGVSVLTGSTDHLYLGTINPTSATQTVDTIAQRFVWNNFNRANRTLLHEITEDSHTYTTAAWRAYGGDANNDVEVVIGLSENPVNIQVACAAANSAGASNPRPGIGIDSTSASSAQIVHGHCHVAASASDQRAFYSGYPGVGYHRIYFLQYHATPAGTTTWYGDAGGGSDILQSGIMGVVVG